MPYKKHLKTIRSRIKAPLQCGNIQGHDQTDKEFDVSNLRREYATLDELFQFCVVDDNGCWVWQRNCANGYARYRIQGKKYSLHRWVCLITYGEPEPNQVAMHLCDNKPCINPKHLKWASFVENNRDRELKNRGRWRNHEAEFQKRGKWKNYELQDAVQKASDKAAK